MYTTAHIQYNLQLQFTFISAWVNRFWLLIFDLEYWTPEIWTWNFGPEMLWDTLSNIYKMRGDTSKKNPKKTTLVRLQAMVRNAHVSVNKYKTYILCPQCVVFNVLFYPSPLRAPLSRKKWTRPQSPALVVSFLKLQRLCKERLVVSKSNDKFRQHLKAWVSFLCLSSHLLSHKGEKNNLFFPQQIYHLVTQCGLKEKREKKKSISL